MCQFCFHLTILLADYTDPQTFLCQESFIRYFDVAESKNDIGFSELHVALIFEVFPIFVSKRC